MTRPLSADLDAEILSYWREPATLQDVHALFKKIRSNDPVYFCEPLNLWIVSGHKANMQVRSSASFSTAPKNSLAYDPSEHVGRLRGMIRRTLLLMLDSPEHERMRGMVKDGFGRGVAEQMRSQISAMAQHYVTTAPKGEPFDFMQKIAFPLPLQILRGMFGLPPSYDSKLRSWAEGFLNLVVPPSTRGTGADAVGDAMFEDAFDGLIGIITDRAKGDRKEDILQHLVDAEQRGEMSNEEIVAFLLQLVVGGHETTAGLITNGLICFQRHPDQWQALRENPALLKSAIDEIVRYEGPSAQNQLRFPLEDTEVGGKTIRKGESIALLGLAANRDPEAFEEPDRFDIGRRSNRHMGFGFGMHFCVGAFLARTEAEEAFRALSDHAPAIEIVDDLIKWDSRLNLHKPVSLSVQIPTRSSAH